MLKSDQEDTALLDGLLSQVKSSSGLITPKRQDNMEAKQPVVSKTLSDFDKAEISQLHENIKNYDNSRWQLAVFFGTANITSVGLGLSLQRYGIVLLSATILALLIIGDILLKASLIVSLYRGLKLESIYTTDKTSFFRVYITTNSPPYIARRFLGEMEKLLLVDEVETVSARLRRFIINPYGIRSGVAFVASFGILIEITIGIILSYIGWQTF